jgi:hypothetical protein
MAAEDHFLEQDRKDLLALLRMRFETIPPEVVAQIDRIDQLDTLQRLILVAANAADWQVFLEELQAGNQAFKIAGERFNPNRRNEREESNE